MSNLIATLGGPATVARKLGIKSPSVTGWNGRVPAKRCPDMERAFGVPCEEIRPDVRWVRVPDPDWPNPAGRPCIDVASPVAEEVREG